MRSNSIRSRNALSVFGIPGLVCLMAMAVFALEPCKSIRVEVPDPATLNLKDGEHVIARGNTPNGSLEVRVNVKGKDISSPKLFVGGRALRETPESQIPADLRDCVKKAQTAQNVAEPAEYKLAIDPSFAERVRRAGYVKDAKCIVTATCGKALDGKYYCVAYACCTVGGSSACAFSSGLY